MHASQDILEDSMDEKKSDLGTLNISRHQDCKQRTVPDN